MATTDATEGIYETGTPVVRTVVKASCADIGGDVHGGHWRCLTHNQDFPNNLQRESHSGERGSHVLAWVCHEHGPEVP